MRIKEGFLLKKIAGKYIAIPTEGDLDMSTMVILNETGAFLWEKIEEEFDSKMLVLSLLKEYDVDEETARKSVESFVSVLKENELIVE